MDDKNKPLLEYFKKNDPAFWYTIGKNFENPIVMINELIRHYQWIYYVGDIDDLDLGSKSNRYYKLAFVETLARNQNLRNEFFNYFFNSLKIAYDYEKKAWYKDILINIFINNKRLYVFDYLAMYALICSSYTVLRNMIIFDYDFDQSIGIDKIEFIKLMDGISNQDFYDELKYRVKLERQKSSKNIYK